MGIEVEDNIKLVNATNPNIETIRNSVIPTQLCQVKYNTSYSTDFGVFEIGRVANGLKDDGLVDEHKMLAVTLFSKTKSVEKLYFELRDMLATLADNIKHKSLDFEPAKQMHSYEHPRNLNTVICDGNEIGTIGIVHPVVSKRLIKKLRLYLLKLMLNRLLKLQMQVSVMKNRQNILLWKLTFHL